MSRVNLSANEICGTLLGERCNPIEHSLHNWTLPIPEMSLFRKSLLSVGSFKWPFSFRETQHFKVLQLSDMQDRKSVV